MVVLLKLNTASRSQSFTEDYYNNSSRGNASPPWTDTAWAFVSCITQNSFITSLLQCDTIPVLTGQIMQTADSHTYGGYGQVCRGTWVTSTGLKIEVHRYSRQFSALNSDRKSIQVAVKLLKMVYQTKESQSRLKNVCGSLTFLKS